MNAKISVFVICVEAIMYLLLYNLHDCTFKVEYERVDILIVFGHRINSNKRPRSLLNFSIFKGGIYSRDVSSKYYGIQEIHKNCENADRPTDPSF